MKTITISDNSDQGYFRDFPYKEFRPYQPAAIRTISRAFEKGYRYVFLEAPTGFGKSAVAITLARKFSPSYILVSSKTLQRQYLTEKGFRTVEVKGRGNFHCRNNKTVSCELGKCMAGDRCDHQPASSDNHEFMQELAQSKKRGILSIPMGQTLCEYWRQKCDGLNHCYPVFNYSYFLHETHYAGDFGKRRLLICDEAHNVEQSLMGFMEMTISDIDLKLINQRVPEGNLSVQEWTGHISEWGRLFHLEWGYTREKLKNSLRGERIKLIEKVNDLAQKMEKLETISKEIREDSENWVIYTEDIKAGKRVHIRPVFVNKYSGMILELADLFLFQSATIINADYMAKSLDVPSIKSIFIRIPSTFSPGRRPLYYRPRGRMSRNSIRRMLPLLAKLISSLMKEYRNEKGVIHTHNYNPIQTYLMDNIKSERLIFNPDAIVRERIFREFMKSKEPKILVTPSAYEGVDFKQDICRWQVICKVPYPYLGNAQVEKRKLRDPEWYNYQTALRLVQTYGRGMREHNDWCDTYIFDTCFTRFYRKNLKMFPEWFKEAVIVI